MFHGILQTLVWKYQNKIPPRITAAVQYTVGFEQSRFYFFRMKEGTSGVKPRRVWVRGGSDTPSS